jgi:hypothetical protein
MGDSSLSAVHYAERLRWFASEYLELRRSKGSLLDHLYLTDELVQLIYEACRNRLLPHDLLSLAESSEVDSALVLGVHLIGYQSFVDVTQPDDDFPDDPTRVLELRPGWMGELWPKCFPVLVYISGRPDEPYGEMIYKAKKNRFFIYVGAFAKLCELIAEGIEREMAADDRADKDGLFDEDRRLIWGGVQFMLTTNQAMVFRLLVDAYPRDVLKSKIEEKLGDGELRDSFRRKDSQGKNRPDPCWGLIVPGSRKDSKRLIAPEEVASNPEKFSDPQDNPQCSPG